MKLNSLILFVFLFSIIACEKGDDGATGPQGPMGTNGTNGSANINVTTFSVSQADWNSIGTGVWGITINDSAITDADNDLVSVYMSVISGTWWAIPTSSFFASTDFFDFNYYTGNVNIVYSNSTKPTSTLLFKVVVIPPSGRNNNPIKKR